jgi:hypothetical protein
MPLQLRIISLLFLFAWPFTSKGQDHFRFKTYGLKEGLSQSMVKTILQDSRGFLWFGTQDGWFASNWDGVRTNEQVLGGGNLRVNAGGTNVGTISNSITLTSNANPSVSGQAVTFKATVLESNSALPTGYITFVNGTTVLANVPVATASGVTSASFTTSTLSSGTHPIRAYYSGDVKFLNTESAVLNQVVTGGATYTLKEQSGSRQTVQVKAERFSMQALPNPSVHQFRIVLQSNLEQPVTIRITDVLGRVVESRSNVAPNSTLQVGSTYRPGVYMIEAAQGNHRQTIKLLKQ